VTQNQNLLYSEILILFEGEIAHVRDIITVNL